ncbi:MAG: tetratricopeptide repeat protein [Bacteroidales bacterium]
MLSLSKYLIFFLVFGANSICLSAQKIPEAYYRLQAAIDIQDKLKAQEWADSCKEIKPIKYQYLIAIGEANFLVENYSEALSYFLKSESLRNGSASYLLAKTYCAIGDSASCFEWLRKNLESTRREREHTILLEPVFEKYHNSISWKNIWEKDWYNSLDKAIADAEYLNSNQNYEETLELLNARIKGTKSRYILYELRGDAYLHLDNFSAAIDDYSVAYKKSRKDPLYLVKIAQAQMAKKQYQLAIKKLDDAVAESDGNPKFQLIRAKAYNEMGQPANGLEDIRYYIDFYPNDTKAIELLSQSAYDAGQYVDALFALAKLSKTNPNNPKYRYLRGLIYMKTEQMRLAIAEFDFAIVNEFNVMDSYFNKAIALYNLGELKDACKCFSISHQYGKFDAQEWLFKHCKN